MRIAASAPTRIDLAGGTIDIWPLYLFHDGAATLNAAISLRAEVAVESRADEGVALRSIDAGREVGARRWSDLDPAGQLPLLVRAARHYRIERVSVTTQAQSPAGAGIAGSSALTIALCGALARLTGASMNPDDILHIAMNVECQTIHVPTGVQDYRPAMYGGVAAIELRTDGVRRVALDVDPRELEQRIVLAYTGAPRHSGTNNWEITKRHLDGDRDIFDCFERIRDTAAAMRIALERGDWDEVGRQIAVEWSNRKRLAPGVTTPAIEELVARATAAGATAAKVCGAGGGGCLFCFGPPTARTAVAEALAAGGARILDYHVELTGCSLDNLAIARVLREIADLLEIRSDNPFKIRAYRNAADIAANHPHHLPSLDEIGLREIPGIGKDLAARIREIAETGGAAFHRELLAEFPPTILDLLHLHGVGPKTVATLYRELGIRTLAELERAATDGRIRALRGMGAKKEGLILKALEERKQHAGRHLLPHAHAAAEALAAHLRERAPQATVTPVGSLRRGCDTCGDLDLLASGAGPSLMDDFVSYPLVERVLGRGETKSSVLIRGGFQADLRLVPSVSRGAALQYFTGSRAHNIALRDRAIGLGFRLNEYGVFKADDETCVAGESEEDVYAALGLEWIPPELREMRGEIEAAQAGRLPRLIDVADLRGDLHMHTVETDGKDTVGAMADAARAAGLEYMAITDHSQALAMANGLDERRALAHAARIRAVDASGCGVRLLAGVECDIRPDGSLDLADDCLAALDLVIASVHSAFNQDHEAMTNRLLRALENPYVDILGHPTGRRILKREPYPFDVAAVVDAAATRGVALEINCQIDRLDLSDVHATLARERGARLVISSDAHSPAAVGALRWGALVARRAWLEPVHVLNTRPFDEFRRSLRRNRP